MISAREQFKLLWRGLKKGYKYNGCSGVPDFDFGYDCCNEHDYHYQAGDMTRWQADKRLRQCIQQKGYVVLPWIYWLGVRVFGRRYYKRRRNNA